MKGRRSVFGQCDCASPPPTRPALLRTCAGCAFCAPGSEAQSSVAVRDPDVLDLDGAAQEGLALCRPPVEAAAVPGPDALEVADRFRLRLGADVGCGDDP